MSASERTMALRALRVTAMRLDQKVTAEQFTDALELLIDSAKVFALDTLALSALPLATPAAPSQSDNDAAGSPPDPESTGPAGSQSSEPPPQPTVVKKAHPRGNQKLSDAVRQQIRDDYSALTADGAQLPRGWLAGQARQHGVTDGAIYFILEPLRKEGDKAPTSKVSKNDQAELREQYTALMAKDKRLPLGWVADQARRLGVSGETIYYVLRAAKAAPSLSPTADRFLSAPRAASTPRARKPEPKHRELTDAEKAELARRFNIVTRDGTLSIPPMWAKDRADELRVPASTVIDAVQHLKAAPRAAKERDPHKALETPPPRADRYKTRRLEGAYGTSYGRGYVRE